MQYGPRAQAAMVHLNLNHAVSVERTAALMKDLFDLPVSQATVIKAGRWAQTSWKPSVEDIGQKLWSKQRWHMPMRAACGLADAALAACIGHRDTTWMGCHPKRGGEAFESLALQLFSKGVLVHDGWIPTRPWSASTPCATNTTCAS
ncbi:MAG: transposase [Comamonadaceae bacterium]|nr:transposase [Comamonadaceae bacterium]